MRNNRHSRTLTITISAVLSCFVFLLSITDLQAKTTPTTYKINDNNKIEVEGSADIGIAVRNQSAAFENDRLPNENLNSPESGSGNDLHKNTAAAIDIDLTIKLDGTNVLYNFDYGAELQLERQVNTYYTIGTNVRESYLFLKKENYGRFEAGRNISASQKMKIGGETLARGAGGVSGQYLDYVSLPMLGDGSQASGSGSISNSTQNVKLPRFILTPQHPVAHGGYAKGYENPAFYDSGRYKTNHTHNNVAGDFGNTQYAPKITYYSPRIKGFKAGVSYTDNAGSLYSASNTSSNGEIENVVDWGLSYVNSFNNLGLALSVTGENGRFKEAATSSRKDLNSIEYGFNVIYGGFTVGGSYGNWGNSLQETTGIYARDYDPNKTLANNDGSSGNEFDDATYYTAGIAYQFGPVAASITHLESEFQENDYQATSVGMDYKWKKYAVPYAELTHFQFESNQPQSSDIDCTGGSDAEKQLKDNEGFVFLTGVVITF